MMINAVIVMSILGFLAGVGLAVANKFFSVVEDPKFEALKAVLPGVNCGGCGFAGCAGAARALISGKASINVCTAGGFEVMAGLARILGIKSAYAGPVTVIVKCIDGIRAETRYSYKGADDCTAEYLF
jgi:formate dehydrogenase (NADP+) beta subunit